MKLYKLKKLKSLLLSGALAFSLFITGCATVEQETNVGSISSKNESNNNVEISSEVPEGSVKATVERVVDGDTMKLKISETGEVVTLRLLLVDTPESVKKGVDPQPFSIEASNFAKETLLAGDTVYIEYDEGDKTDKYDRHLGYLWFSAEDGNGYKMFNEVIISEGYARVGYVYSQKLHLDKLNVAQENAKAEGLNIWSVPGYVTSKGFDVDAYNANSSSDNSSTSENTTSKTVYANTNSNTYHSSADAHGMKSSVKLSEDEAKVDGYTPCSKCF
ncbi:MAG: thermonuclease family protein [Peptostreptococcaceae bacterium]